MIREVYSTRSECAPFWQRIFERNEEGETQRWHVHARRRPPRPSSTFFETDEVAAKKARQKAQIVTASSIVWSFLLVLPCGLDAFATELTQVTVEGEDSAQIYFFAKSLETLPSLSLRENVLELSFPGVILSSESADKIEYTPNHPLLARISVFPTLHGIKAHVVIRGSQSDLRDRVRVERHPKGVKLNIDFPKGQATALGLLQREELPISGQPPKTRDLKKNTGLRWGISLGALCIAALSAFFGFRMIRRKSHPSGHRKYLIENISFCSLGPKSGVALLKIGKEFILVGVTPGRISMLSVLSKLSSQYEEETQYERSAFKEVVSEEYQRLQKSALSV